MNSTKCLRCGAPNATRYSPFWDRGNVCVQCQSDLDLLKLEEKYPGHIRVDAIAERFAARLAVNTKACSECKRTIDLGQEHAHGTETLCLRCHAELLGIDEYEMEEV